MSRMSWAVIALLVASWALCCLIVPISLWDSFMHDYGRYQLLSPDGEFLPTFVPACIGSALFSAVAALAAARSMHVKAVRRTVLALAALAVLAMLVASPFGFVLLAASCLIFFASMALAYVSRAERAFGNWLL